MKKIYLTLCIALSCTLSSSFAQQAGCTDSRANNYDAAAEVNNGSCTYNSTSYQMTLVDSLTDTLNETSGLWADQSGIWTINDSGNEPFLFLLDTTGAILKKVFIRNAINNDWEAIAGDANYIYIGDIGNNSGIRTDLAILKLEKSVLMQHDSVDASFIYYSYEDQDSFINLPQQNRFDAEAMIVYNNQIHLFTKDWVNNFTYHYTFPNTIGTHSAMKKDSMLVDGLITDATIDTVHQRILLLGYQQNTLGLYSSFVWLLFDYPNEYFFKGNKRRIEIGDVLTVGQTEGVCFDGKGKGYISGEKIAHAALPVSFPAKLSKFDFESYLETRTLHILNPASESGFNIYPNPTSEKLYINSTMQSSFLIHNSVGQLQMKGWMEKGTLKLDIEHWAPGMYLVQMPDVGIKKFIKSK